MPIIQFVLALVILGVLYTRMIRREEPNQISKMQAVIPVVFGVVSVPVSFFLFLGIGSLLVKTGISFNQLPAAVSSIIRAFFVAGFPEEITKLLFMLLSILIFRSRIRNVYEYVLVGAGVGMGFTVLEEFFYGSDGLSALLRIITLGAHMIFGMIMARHLGMASCKKANGETGVAAERFLAIVIPVIIHTLFDASNGTNRMLESSNDIEQIIGIVVSLAGTAVLFALQIIILRGFRKKSGEYCGLMTANPVKDTLT